ncbi:MAG: low molecular weight phosphotyrosine protein phosphatase [Epsilonproteobacteria bacterium]|nr:low molecular weight phosphotyrosine protein phosphatase [Campylobacterota bacterium]
MQSVLFVCLGNICRSPIAEGVAKELIESHALHVTIDSAGTGDWHIGEPPCKNSIKVAKEHGVDISHLRARKVTKEDFEKFDLLVALDANNLADLVAMGAKNVVKLGSFGYDGKDVPDPYFFRGFEGFERVYEMIESCVANLVKEKFLGE